MSEADPIPILPDADTFLGGKEGVKPLHYKSEALTKFVEQFEDRSIAPYGAETLVQLGDVMQRPHWAATHDAAHDAIEKALLLVKDNPPEDIAKLSYAIESLYKSRAPNVDTVKGIKHPILEDTLKPLVTYLEEFANFINGWAGLSPARIKAKGEDAITPAEHRKKIQDSAAIIPECGDTECTVDHSNEANKTDNKSPPPDPMAKPNPKYKVVKPLKPKNTTKGNGVFITKPPAADDNDKEHVHGPGCNHGHDNHSTSGDNSQDSQRPKGKYNSILPVGGAAAAAFGAYIINEYGKEDKKATNSKDNNNSPVNYESNISRKEIEQGKSQRQQAEDIAYTLNHSVYCTLTDFLNPPINAATDGYLSKLFPGCGHDHGGSGDSHHVHGANCTHGDHQHPPSNLSRFERTKLAFQQSFSKERFTQYAKGEFIGDFAAVPLTIFTQRTFPNFMNGIRKLCEPIIGPLFKWGVERDNKDWAKKHNIANDSQEYKEHAAKVYEYEISHFPQAVVWTGFSLGLNTGYQMWTDKRPIPFAQKLLLKGSSVLSGVLVTAGMVVAARVFAPNKMHSLDQWASDKIVLPVTKTTGKMFGIKDEDITRMVEKEKELEQTPKAKWEKFVDDKSTSQSSKSR